jgi:hypothetical protein
MDTETEKALADIYAQLMRAWWRLGAKLPDQLDPEFERAGRALDRFQTLLCRLHHRRNLN